MPFPHRRRRRPRPASADPELSTTSAPVASPTLIHGSGPTRRQSPAALRLRADRAAAGCGTCHPAWREAYGRKPPARCVSLSVPAKLKVSASRFGGGLGKACGAGGVWQPGGGRRRRNRFADLIGGGQWGRGRLRCLWRVGFVRGLRGRLGSFRRGFAVRGLARRARRGALLLHHQQFDFAPGLRSDLHRRQRRHDCDHGKGRQVNQH